MSNLWDATVKLTGDYFQLSRVGMGSLENLRDISLYAIQAGMSFKEYTKLIHEGITVASKAGTLENFNKIISAQDKQLAAMGIFGNEAREFQLVLAQSSASLGIPMENLTQATGDQVSIFDKLSKVTNISTEQFQDMVKHIANSTDAQKELLGLAPKERAARMNQLLELHTIGASLGMTAEASRQLGDALMKQRQATVQERLSQGGAIMQMGGFTGNGELAQRLYQLNLKGRNRTKDEDAEFFNGIKQLETSAQGMYENGNLGVQNVLDQLESTMGSSGLGNLVDQSRTAQLAQEAGAQNQEAFGKHVGEFGQWVGKLTAWAAGLKESVLGSLVAGIGARF
jgi:hypothetical protein